MSKGKGRSRIDRRSVVLVIPFAFVTTLQEQRVARSRQQSGEESHGTLAPFSLNAGQKSCT